MEEERLIIDFEEINNYFFIEKNSVIKIHNYLISKFNKNIEFGLLNESLLDFYFVKYYIKKNIIYKIAYMFNLFLQNGHPFLDGNKRTGFLVCFYMLQKIILK